MVSARGTAGADRSERRRGQGRDQCDGRCFVTTARPVLGWGSKQQAEQQQGERTEQQRQFDDEQGGLRTSLVGPGRLFGALSSLCLSMHSISRCSLLYPYPSVLLKLSGVWSETRQNGDEWQSFCTLSESNLSFLSGFWVLPCALFPQRACLFAYSRSNTNIGGSAHPDPQAPRTSALTCAFLLLSWFGQ